MRTLHPVFARDQRCRRLRQALVVGACAVAYFAVVTFVFGGF